jgi:Rrf2 family protein
LISRKGKYALRAVFELAYRNEAGPVKIQDIARAQAIPENFLQVILTELKHAGFVTSQRGAEGGYMLAVAPDELTVGQILGFLGENQQIEPAESSKQDRFGDYAFSRMWSELNRAIDGIYEKNTFADMVEEELRERKQQPLNYVI